MGTGIAEGEKRAIDAARRAIENPLLDDSSIEGARGVIVNITGGSNLSLDEASEATELITRAADPEANVIYGIVIDDQMGEKVKVTVIATGFRRPALPVTPVDLGNYRFGDGSPSSSTTAPASPATSVPASGAVNSSSFYRKTPQHPLAAPSTPGTDTSNLDVPTFLRKQSNG